ncbi:MAG TPA: hypothetical protein VG326_16035 [Tepidisphaeraceae bacterium]|jgi:hypothetical protein|nr:hypothetical protein [Tepidisphaeraceae bacterium]
MNDTTSQFPSLYEIFLFPIGGATLIEGLHTKRNELPLLFAPFLIVVVRLFIAEFEEKQYHRDDSIPRHRCSARFKRSPVFALGRRPWNLKLGVFFTFYCGY